MAKTVDGVVYESIEGGISIVGYDSDSPYAVIPRSIDGREVIEIGKRAFKGKSFVKSIAIPPTVKSMGFDAFMDCGENLQVHIEDIASWCNIYFDEAFANPLSCDGSLYLNGSIVAEIEIPVGVKAVGRYAFSGCMSLTGVRISEGVELIGDGAFEYCRNLKSICLSDSVTYIGQSAFSDCGLLEIALPKNLQAICESTFERCSKLTVLTIPDGLSRIENYAFAACESLKRLDIPDSVTQIKEYAFHMLDNTVIRKPSCEGDIYQLGGFEYVVDGNFAKITKYVGESKAAVIPKTLDGREVTAVGEYAFAHCKSLESVEIHGGIKQLSADAFYDCANLVEVKICDGVERINYECFCHCKSLTGVEIPDSVQYIGWHAFSGCENLRTVNLPSSLKTVDGLAFAGCKSLESVYIPKGVEKIGQKPFAGCDSLQSITVDRDNAIYKSQGDFVVEKITGALVCAVVNNLGDRLVVPDGIKAIASDVFCSCRFESVALPDSVERIGREAFSYCGNLKSIVIPSGVKYMDEYVFEGCRELTLYCKAESKPDGWDEDWNLVEERPDEWEADSGNYVAVRFRVVWGYNGK